jgi:putative AdoMet-dependent methyltransferase
MTDLFPASDFDRWADSYDQSTRAETIFPFDGYDDVLDAILRQAAPRPGMTVLDIGAGTANLALRFAEQGCDLWCTDFAPSMLEKARAKLPAARFFLHDFRTDLPPELEGKRFDAVVSAYVFHHVELPGKVEICKSLAARNLAPGGALVIGDLSFPNQLAMDAFAASIPDLWEVEFYWLADESLTALTAAGLRAEYLQVSACAGVYTIRT